MPEDLVTNLANAFDPVPLPADSPLYVDLKAVRADADVCRDLGKKIIRSPLEKYTYQLYAGHRGGGKSTELLRLKKYLEGNGCFVVYFAADESDIDPEDAQYTDILIACTRNLLKGLKNADSKLLQNWLKDRWQDLIDLSLTEIKIEDVKLETGDLIKYFGKLSAAIRAIPGQRQKIREKINPHTITLLVEYQQWKILVKVHQTKEIQNDETHRQLLFNRCILQYSCFEQNDNLNAWYDVHPLINEIKEFQDVLKTL
jgi:hypothetical protein